MKKHIDIWEGRSFDIMEKRSIEVGIISARGLKKVAPLWKMRTYAVAWINPEHKYCTKIDKHGDTHPVWNMKFSCIVDDQTLQNEDDTISSVTVEIHSMEPVFHCHKLECSATILLKEFIAKSNRNGEDHEERASFQLRSPSGKARGMVDVSIRIGPKFNSDMMSPKAASEQSGTDFSISEDDDEPVTAYPAQLSSKPSGRPEDFPPPNYPYNVQSAPKPNYGPISAPNYGPISAPNYRPVSAPARPPPGGHHYPPPPYSAYRPPFASNPPPPLENYFGLPGGSAQSAGNNNNYGGVHPGLGLGAGALLGGAVGGLMFGMDGSVLQNGLNDAMSQFHGGTLSISTDPFF
eukprot:Gb_07666 [translate_table: standard]